MKWYDGYREPYFACLKKPVEKKYPNQLAETFKGLTTRIVFHDCLFTTLAMKHEYSYNETLLSVKPMENITLRSDRELYGVLTFVLLLQNFPIRHANAQIWDNAIANKTFAELVVLVLHCMPCALIHSDI